MRTIGALLLLPLVLAAQAKPEEPCTLSGQVVNTATGEPVRRALVVLHRIDSSRAATNIQSTHSVTTDTAGRFAMEGVAPGKYRLSASRNGFVETQYGARAPGKTGTLMTLEAGQKSTDLAMRLTPHGVVAGRVLDEEGEPLTGVDVQVTRQQYIQGRKQLARAGSALTNDLGEYRVFGIPPGRYYVSATLRANPNLPQTDEEYVTTWFPRTPDASAAAPVDLAPGAQLRNIDIPLSKMRTVTVRGRVTSEAGAPAGGDTAPRSFLNVMISARSTTVFGGAFARGATVGPQGTFEFRGIAPGSYTVVGQTNAQGKVLQARTSIQVGSSNVEGVLLTIHGGVAVSGRVRVEGETSESLAAMAVVLQPVEVGGMVFGSVPSQPVKADGTFQLDDVAADRYNVTINRLPEGFYVKSVRSATLDVMGSGLEVAGTSPAPIEVLLSPHAGQVSGSVLDPKTQKPAPTVTVVLIPQEKERRDRESFYRTAVTDQSGQFTFKSVVPGEYRVYAWEDAEYGVWMDPDFLKPVESKGEAVSIAESSRQSVQVNLIPAEAAAGQ
jgi:protocatechuate 3,4-dioxygenase beta subunit